MVEKFQPSGWNSDKRSAIIISIFFVIFATTAVSTVKVSKHPVVIIISYDGFRYDYFNKTPTPNMDWVKKGGVTIPYLQNQFLTYTFPNHHSIATGLYIESHGIISNSFYDPLYRKKLSGFTNDPGFWNYSSSILPLYTLNELAGDGRYSGSMMWPGSGEPWGPKRTRNTYNVLYDNSQSYRWRVDKVLDWITNPEKPANLVFLYFGQPDGTGHDKGPESLEIISAIQLVDDITGYITRKIRDMRIEDKVNLVFVSDHGMQQVKTNGKAKFLHVMDNTGDKMYHDQGRGTPLLQVSPVRRGDTQKIYEAFKADGKTNHYKAYLTEEVSKVKPYWHYSNNRRIMPIYLTSDLGYLFEGASFRAGSHGWDNHEPSMRAYFMAKGPAFKSRSVEQTFENIDIYPMVSHILNLKTPHINGSLARSKVVLKDQ